MKNWVFAFVILASIFLSACKVQPTSAPTPAPTANSAPFCDRREVENSVRRFDDLLSYFAYICENVDVDDRTSIENSMSEVTLMKEKLILIDAPPCLIDSKNYLNSAMDALYEGLWNTKMGSARWYIDEKLSTSEEKIKMYTDALMRAKLFVSD